MFSKLGSKKRCHPIGSLRSLETELHLSESHEPPTPRKCLGRISEVEFVRTRRIAGSVPLCSREVVVLFVHPEKRFEAKSGREVTLLIDRDSRVRETRGANQSKLSNRRVNRIGADL
jgi:hypothetical protein